MRVLCCVQDCAQLSKEVTELQERLSERDDEISELKAERNNTRVSQSVTSCHVIVSTLPPAAASALCGVTCFVEL